MTVQLENVLPREIESRSFEIIGEELAAAGKVLDPEKELIIKRCIHTSADFEYADSLKFSEDVVNKATDILYAYNTDEITSKQIGEAVLDVLACVNEVAYVRFASVFREFKTLDDFEEILKEQKAKGKRNCEEK